MFKQLHDRLVFRRRVKVLSAELLCQLNPGIKNILDVGCGDGSVSRLIQENNPSLKISGIDILQRENSLIPVKLYDGRHIPYEDDSFDCCMFVDVLHHLISVKEMLTECKRVSRRYVLIKDHLYKSAFDFTILKFMDRVGNKPHGVALTYNYLKEEEWNTVFKDSGLQLLHKKTAIPLYPFPFSLLFGRRLHFVCLLEIVK